MLYAHFAKLLRRFLSIELIFVYLQPLSSRAT